MTAADRTVQISFFGMWAADTLLSAFESSDGGVPSWVAPSQGLWLLWVLRSLHGARAGLAEIPPRGGPRAFLPCHSFFPFPSLVSGLPLCLETVPASSSSPPLIFHGYPPPSLLHISLLSGICFIEDLGCPGELWAGLKSGRPFGTSEMSQNGGLALSDTEVLGKFEVAFREDFEYSIKKGKFS